MHLTRCGLRLLASTFARWCAARLPPRESLLPRGVDEVCAICYADTARAARKGRHVVRTRCGHTFCKRCLGAWFGTCCRCVSDLPRIPLAGDLNCPMCRSELDLHEIVPCELIALAREQRPEDGFYLRYFDFGLADPSYTEREVIRLNIELNGLKSAKRPRLAC